MFSHIYISASDFTRAYAFYAPIMAELGLRQRLYVPERSWVGWQPGNGGRPLFFVGKPFNGEAHDPGNGQMVAFMAKDRTTVDKAYELAMANGGKDEGKPALRPHYHEHYYGAYFRDTEGNKVCVVCHDQPAASA